MKLSSSKATIINVNVNSVKVVLWNGIEVQLYNGNSNTLQGDTVLLLVDDENQNSEALIQLTLESSIFPVEEDLSEQITFEINADVTYFNTQKRMIKRTIQQQKIPSYTLSTSAVITNDEESNAGAIMQTGLYLMIMIIPLIF